MPDCSSITFACIVSINHRNMTNRTSSPRNVFKVVTHVILWLVVLLYPLFLQSGKTDVLSLLPRYIISTALLISLFYYNSLVLIPRYLAKRKVALYILLMLVGIIVAMGINIINHYLFYASDDAHGWKLKHQLYDAGFLAIVVWGVSTASRITTEWFNNEVMRKEAEQKQISAELAFLKSQINPHFLFNSLNNIYALCHRSNDPEAAEAIAKLSGLMRYMLFGSATSTVKLKDEIEYLRNYLDLQKMRINKDIEVSFVIKGEVDNFEIAPLLLIPFVENAFKYGLSYVSNSFVRIECTVEKSALKFCVQNTVHERGKSELSSGIGLENVKRRLTLLYPGKHSLRINDSNGIFDVELTITA